jgi:MscS family membrane protein
VKQVLGVTYGTSRDHLQAFVEQVRAYLETVPVIRAEHTHVRFYGFGESSLDIYVSYFLTVGGWADELQWREVINYEIMAIAQRVGVSFAFPSRSVYVETLPAT